MEPSGASNDARGHYGPPSYKDASITLDKPTMRISFTLGCPMGCASVD
ncbi:MAG TPA: hypothetical protein VFG73_01075 [Rhodanobacteraceae bacterium]|nr:hypothetical protein [Rhodanobacteraceae bacterium]